MSKTNSTEKNKTIQLVLARFIQDRNHHFSGSFSDLIEDSYALLEFIVYLEKTLSIQFDLQDLNVDNFKNQDAIIEMINKKYKV